MRILTPGRVADAPEATRPHRGCCKRCGAVVEVFGDEVRRMRRGDGALLGCRVSDTALRRGDLRYPRGGEDMITLKIRGFVTAVTHRGRCPVCGAEVESDREGMLLCPMPMCGYPIHPTRMTVFRAVDEAVEPDEWWD